MKKWITAVPVLIFLSTAVPALAQNSKDSAAARRKAISLKLLDRPNDHLMLQFGYTGINSPVDSTKSGGFSRSFNIYFMYDKPFRTNPNFSLGFGVGMATDNFFYENRILDVKSTGATLPFLKRDSADHYEKFKLATWYVEVPAELRYVSDPLRPDHGWKAAIGLKAGLLLNAWTKGKNYVNKNGASYFGTSYIAKEVDKKFINGTRVAATARIGLGNFSLFGTYMLTSLLESGAGPDMRPYTIGLCVSGL